jgi:anthranilate phosphoribosyltransferase
VGRENLQPLMSQALAMLGSQRAVVVFGGDGLDEVTLAEATHVTETTPRQVRHFVWDPADFELDPVSLETLVVENPQQSAELVRNVLGGEAGPARDIVVANAAAALWTAGRDTALRQCSRLAQESIDSGAAREVLAKLIEKTRG